MQHFSRQLPGQGRQLGRAHAADFRACCTVRASPQHAREQRKPGDRATERLLPLANAVSSERSASHRSHTS